MNQLEATVTLIDFVREREESLTVSFAHFRTLFDGATCVVCLRDKGSDRAFCSECFVKLDGPTCAAFRDAKTILYGFCRALRMFGFDRKRIEDSVVPMAEARMCGVSQLSTLNSQPSAE